MSKNIKEATATVCNVILNTFDTLYESKDGVLNFKAYLGVPGKRILHRVRVLVLGEGIQLLNLG